MTYKVISADAHIDLGMMPHDAFVSNAPLRWKAKMPRVVEAEDGPLWVVGDLAVEAESMAGERVPLGRLFSEENPAAESRAERMEQAGFYEGCGVGVYAPSNPEMRLRHQDRDGIDAEIIYGITFGPERIPDARVRKVVYQTYNDWAAEFRGTHPDRFVPLACLPYESPSEAVEELKRAFKLGLKGAEIRVGKAPVPMFHSDWDPLWSAAEECHMPVSFHIQGLSPKAKEPTSPRYARIFQTMGLIMAQLDGVEFLTSIVLSGACDRFPGFKFVLAESGVGWIPYVIDRMDMEAAGLEGLSLKPSEYWYGQGHSTYQQEGCISHLVSLVGENNAMWGNDYPHTDGIWPDSLEIIERNLKGLQDEVKRKIMCENAGSLYGLMN